MVCACIAVLTPPLTSGAQDIQFGPAGKPTKISMTTDGKYEIPVIVVAEGAQVLTAPKKTAAVARNANYGEAFYLTDTQEESGRKYHLAADRSLKFAGWFRDEDVLLTQQAQKESHGIFLKALIVNDWKTMAGGVSVTGASALKGPGSKPGSSGTPYETLRELGLFKFYFIYKTQKSEDNSEWFLLGFQPRIASPSKAKDSLTGWVDAKRISQWDTRQALQFHKDTLSKRLEGVESTVKGEGGGGVAIFETQEELNASLKGETQINGQPLRPTATENTLMSEQWNYATQRFPLIGTKKNDLVPKAGQYLQVGYIGDVLVGGKSVSKDDKSNLGGITPEKAQEERNKVKEIIKKMHAIDILFVIDTTGSMEAYVAATRKAVTDLSASLEKNYPDPAERPKIRYSVTCYRDYVDQEKSYVIKRLPLTVNVLDVEKFLDEEAKKCEGGGDDNEAMFFGIDQAISSAAKEVDAFSYKVLIVIGDCGNHVVDERGYTVNDIAKRIRDARYEFASMHVVDPSAVEGQPAYKLFQEQTKLISDQMRFGNTKANFTSSNPDSVAQEIARRSFEFVEEQARAKLVGRDLDTGAGLKGASLKYGLKVADRVAEAMAAGGVDMRLFLEKSVQVFGRGWTTESTPNGIPQCEVVLLVEKPTIEVLIGIIAGLIQNPPNKADISKVWGDVLKRSIGEVQEDKPVGEMIENHLGLPIRTKILGYNLSQLSNLGEEELAKSWEELERAKQMLTAFLNEKNVVLEEETTPSGSKRLVAKDRGSRKVWWPGEDQDYGWIKLTEMP